jgi:hypothetical protein
MRRIQAQPERRPVIAEHVALSERNTTVVISFSESVWASGPQCLLASGTATHQLGTLAAGCPARRAPSPKPLRDHRPRHRGSCVRKPRACEKAAAEARQWARRAVFGVVRGTGGQIIGRPVFRHDPQSGPMQAAEAIAGLRAARDVELAALLRWGLHPRCPRDRPRLARDRSRARHHRRRPRRGRRDHRGNCAGLPG